MYKYTHIKSEYVYNAKEDNSTYTYRVIINWFRRIFFLGLSESVHDFFTENPVNIFIY